MCVCMYVCSTLTFHSVFFYICFQNAPNNSYLYSLLYLYAYTNKNHRSTLEISCALECEKRAVCAFVNLPFVQRNLLVKKRPVLSIIAS